MSRKRDSNWSRDEIMVLLDSMMEITKTRAQDLKRTNSREVFEYAAKKMGEMGHHTRAEKEKCRIKWKKMKEEFTNAKKAREGDPKFKESPGIQPFYDRMEEFIFGNFDNISPHSTIVRRSSNLSSNKTPSAMRTSARIAATTTNGTSSTVDNNDTSASTIVIKTNTSHTEYPSTTDSTLLASPLSTHQTNLLSSGNSSADVRNTTGATTTIVNDSGSNNITFSSTNMPITRHQQPQQQAVANTGACVYAAYNTGIQNNNNSALTTSEPLHAQTNEHVDISYRVSTGCRQITIFGDHDVDIKFRGDCVTINKINGDYPAATADT